MVEYKQKQFLTKFSRRAPPKVIEVIFDRTRAPKGRFHCKTVAGDDLCAPTRRRINYFFFGEIFAKPSRTPPNAENDRRSAAERRKSNENRLRFFCFWSPKFSRIRAPKGGFHCKTVAGKMYIYSSFFSRFFVVFVVWLVLWLGGLSRGFFEFSVETVAKRYKVGVFFTLKG